MAATEPPEPHGARMCATGGEIPKAREMAGVAPCMGKLPDDSWFSLVVQIFQRIVAHAQNIQPSAEISSLLDFTASVGALFCLSHPELTVFWGCSFGSRVYLLSPCWTNRVIWTFVCGTTTFCLKTCRKCCKGEALYGTQVLFVFYSAINANVKS